MTHLHEMTRLGGDVTFDLGREKRGEKSIEQVTDCEIDALLHAAAGLNRSLRLCYSTFVLTPAQQVPSLLHQVVGFVFVKY